MMSMLSMVSAVNERGIKYTLHQKKEGTQFLPLNHPPFFMSEQAPFQTMDPDVREHLVLPKLLFTSCRTRKEKGVLYSRIFSVPGLN